MRKIQKRNLKEQDMRGIGISILNETTIGFFAPGSTRDDRPFAYFVTDKVAFKPSFEPYTELWKIYQNNVRGTYTYNGESYNGYIGYDNGEIIISFGENFAEHYYVVNKVNHSYTGDFEE